MNERDITKLEAAAYGDGLNDALRIIDKYKEQFSEEILVDRHRIWACEDLIELIEAKTRRLVGQF